MRAAYAAELALRRAASRAVDAAGPPRLVTLPDPATGADLKRFTAESFLARLPRG